MAPAANVTLKGRALGLSLALSVISLWNESDKRKANDVKVGRITCEPCVVRAQGMKGVYIPFRSWVVLILRNG